MTIHVYPENDWIDHDTDYEASGLHRCTCDPDVIWTVDGEPLDEPIVLHFALDGRE